MCAIETIGAIGTPAAIIHLRRIAEDATAESHVAAIACMWIGQCRNPQAVAVLEDALDSTDVEVRRAASGALLKAGGQTVSAWVLRCLGDNDYLVRRHGLWATLEHLDPAWASPVIDELSRLQKDPDGSDTNLRIATAILTKLGGTVSNILVDKMGGADAVTRERYVDVLLEIEKLPASSACHLEALLEAKDIPPAVRDDVRRILAHHGELVPAQLPVDGAGGWKKAGDGDDEAR